MILGFLKNKSLFCEVAQECILVFVSKTRTLNKLNLILPLDNSKKILRALQC